MKNIFFLSTIILLFAACNERKKESGVAKIVTKDNQVVLTNVQSKNAGIVLGKLVQKEISSTLKLNGRIDVPPQSMISVSAPLGGYLKNTRLLPGMHLSKGEVIAVMEDQQYIQLQQDYLTAIAKISFLNNEYNRQKELNRSKASSDKVYQQAEADYKSQKILVSALAQKLQLIGINPGKLNENNISKTVNIVAPINCFVSKINVNIGKYIAPTDVMFELVDPTDIHLALKVFEKDLGKLSIGQKLVAYTNNQPATKYICEILLIGKDISTDGSADVHCHFKTFDQILVPGTYMNAEVDLKNTVASVLPEDAVVRFAGKNYVFIALADNHFDMTEVQTGNTENGYIEIVAPQNMADQQFVIKGAYSLLMSLKNKTEE